MAYNRQKPFPVRRGTASLHGTILPCWHWRQTTGVVVQVVV